MSSRKQRNWLVWIFFFGAVFVVGYIINVFGIFGLIFWEIAFLFFIPGLIGIIWAVRRIIGVKKQRLQKYKHFLVAITLIILIVFNIFALIPFFYVNPLGNNFEARFKQVLGDDYYNRIPEKYQNYLKTPNSFFDYKDLKYFLKRDITVESNIKYGEEHYQVLDKYEDKTIIDSNKPAVIIIHGGGSTTIATKDNLQIGWQCNYFANIGFVAFSIEYTPTEINPFPKGVADARKAIVFIKEHAKEYNIDNNSIVLFGGSRGGNLVTLIPYAGMNDNLWWKEHGGDYTAEQLRVACVVDFYGAVDQFYSHEYGGFLASRNEIIFGGTPETLRDMYGNHTVKNFVTDKCPPTLIIHGTIDKIVEIQQSRDLASALDAKGVINIYLEVPFGQHGFEAVPGSAGNLLSFYFAPRFIFSILYG